MSNYGPHDQHNLNRTSGASSIASRGISPYGFTRDRRDTNEILGREYRAFQHGNNNRTSYDYSRDSQSEFAPGLVDNRMSSDYSDHTI